jgi:hypothetical protein
MTALAPGLIRFNVFYSRRLKTRNRLADKNRPCVRASPKIELKRDIY